MANEQMTQVFSDGDFLRKASTEEKLELGILAFSEALKLNALLLQRESELLDHLDNVLKVLIKITCKWDALTIERALDETVNTGDKHGLGSADSG